MPVMLEHYLVLPFYASIDVWLTDHFALPDLSHYRCNRVTSLPSFGAQIKSCSFYLTQWPHICAGRRFIRRSKFNRLLSQWGTTLNLSPVFLERLASFKDSDSAREVAQRLRKLLDVSGLCSGYCLRTKYRCYPTPDVVGILPVLTSRLFTLNILIDLSIRMQGLPTDIRVGAGGILHAGMLNFIRRILLPFAVLIHRSLPSFL